MSGPPAGHSAQVDALRGLAAAVALLHVLTAGHDLRYVHEGASWAAWSVIDWRLWGVGGLFVLAGQGLLASVSAGPSPGRWLVRRCLRAVPVYWAAVLVCGSLLVALQLPGQVRSARELAGHLLLTPQHLGIAPVDAAWWAVQAGMFVAAWWFVWWQAGGLAGPARTLGAWVALCLVAGLLADRLAAAPAWAQPWLSVLALPWVPWFVLGAAVRLVAIAGTPRERTGAWWLGAGCVAALAAWHGTAAAAVAAAWALGLLAVLRGRGRAGRGGAWAWLGHHAHTLYLVQASVAAPVILLLSPRLGAVSATLLAGAAAIAAAAVLHAAVQAPASRLADRWREPAGRVAARRGVAGMAAMMVALSGLALAPIGVQALRHPHPPPQWALAPAKGPPCPAWPDGAPVMVLVMGQSNAASHAQVALPRPGPVPVWREGSCRLAGDPLPGTTGTGASVWTAMAPAWSRRWPGRPVVLAPLAVEGTRMAQWVAPGPLHELLRAHLRDVAASGWPVAAVLWQQGEADMLDGTPAHAYGTGLAALRAQLDAHGITAPLFIATSTYCRGVGTGAIRRALARLHATGALERVQPGPDTDALPPEARADGCHFSAQGRRQAAAAWAEALR